MKRQIQHSNIRIMGFHLLLFLFFRIVDTRKILFSYLVKKNKRSYSYYAQWKNEKVLKQSTNDSGAIHKFHFLTEEKVEVVIEKNFRCVNNYNRTYQGIFFFLIILSAKKARNRKRYRYGYSR